MTNDNHRAGDEPSSQANVPNAAPATTVDATGRHVLAVDIFCIRCGYNLRGLLRETVCPECGGQIERSLHGRWLRFAEPSWLDSLRFGTLLMLWNLLLMLGTGIAAGIFATLGSPIAWVNLLDIPSAAIAVWAIVLVTRQEPAIALTEEAMTLRKALRRAAVLILVLHVVKLGVGFSFGMIGIQLMILALQIVGVVVQCCLLAYFRGLAARIPRPWLEKSTTRAIWGIAASGGVSIGFNLTAFWILTQPPGGPAMWLIVVQVGIGVVGLVFFVWYVVLLFLYHGAWKQALREVDMLGAAPSPTPAVVRTPDAGGPAHDCQAARSSTSEDEQRQDSIKDTE